LDVAVVFVAEKWMTVLLLHTRAELCQHCIVDDTTGHRNKYPMKGALYDCSHTCIIHLLDSCSIRVDGYQFLSVLLLSLAESSLQRYVLSLP